MYIRVLCTIIYQSDDLALSASDINHPVILEQARPCLKGHYINISISLLSLLFKVSHSSIYLISSDIASMFSPAWSDFAQLT